MATSIPKVFLWYAHAEHEIAELFREALGSRGLAVVMDSDHLKPSENITDFIRGSIRTSEATVCIVSTASLTSAWVVFEAVSTLHKEHTNPATRLIACATDSAFFDPGFRLDVTRSLDEQLETLNGLVMESLAKQLDLTDLVAERSRLLTMRNTLGDVLARLKSNLTLTLTRENVLTCATRVADYVRELHGQQPERMDVRDIRRRAEELRQHLWDGRTEDALQRMLDFVREFSNLPKHVRDATSIANTLRRVERAEKDDDLPFGEAEKQRQPAIYRLLELIDEIEIAPQLPVAS